MEVCFEVIKKDSLNSSRPISNQAETPTQIQEMFDMVSYNKVGDAAGGALRSHVRRLVQPAG